MVPWLLPISVVQFSLMRIFKKSQKSSLCGFCILITFSYSFATNDFAQADFSQTKNESKNTRVNFLLNFSKQLKEKWVNFVTKKLHFHFQTVLNVFKRMMQAKQIIASLFQTVLKMFKIRCNQKIITSLFSFGQIFLKIFKKFFLWQRHFKNRNPRG